MEFEAGKFYTNAHIAGLGGEQQLFLAKTKGGKVVAGRFQEKRNPQLPTRLFVGENDKRLEAARMFRLQTEFIPVFVQPLKPPRGPSKWRYEGKWRVANRTVDPIKDDEEVLIANTKWQLNPMVSLVLHLEREPSVLREAPSEVVARNPGLNFTPEFEGSKKYNVEGAISSTSHHGTVVNALYAELSARGMNAFNTQNIDLYLVNENGEMTHLFEAKADLTTTDLYGAVGQLMLHGALETAKPHRILVVPDKLNADTARRMKRLGIRLLTYEWHGESPVFGDVASVIPD